MERSPVKTHSVFFVIFLFLFSSLHAQIMDYRDDSLKVTEKVEEFVQSHCIHGTDIEIVQRIIDLIHDDSLFIRIDRQRMQSWITNPNEAEEFKNNLTKLKDILLYLNKLRMAWPLSQVQSVKREELEEMLFYGEHDHRVYEQVIRMKDIYAKDLPFAVSGAEAVEYGIADGCTTATKTFIVLAKAAGIEEIRFVGTGCTSDYNRACPTVDEPREPDVTISGHWFAMVKIEGRWALVNCTYLNPHGMDDSSRYEIFYEFDGIPVSPEMLMLRILKIPSFQKEDICQNTLYVQCVGKDNNDDHEVENWEALMNMSVSGDRDCIICRYFQFYAQFIPF